eukprot:4608528-Alexandrium_andersonii.AAC.1
MSIEPNRSTEPKATAELAGPFHHHRARRVPPPDGALHGRPTKLPSASDRGLRITGFQVRTPEAQFQ